MLAQPSVSVDTGTADWTYDSCSRCLEISNQAILVKHVRTRQIADSLPTFEIIKAYCTMSRQTAVQDRCTRAFPEASKCTALLCKECIWIICAR
mmetsp:Transcript_75631/g.138347  ORF Transcript_75631/g.138347 Transcript_75631/m.138347 type:complete len:94 (-) Transcript_75631:556-837(-)